MKKVKLSLLLGLILFACYSCQTYVRARHRASEAILAGDRFSEAGPQLRIRLSVHDGFTLEAPDGALATFPGTSEAAVELPACKSEVAFAEGSVRWGLNGFARRVRLAARGAPLRVNGIPYGGAIELIPEKGLAVNELTCEEYLLGVVGSESLPSFELAALRAQAVASRTYALYQMLLREGRDWHIDDALQIYRGHAKATDKVTRAVAQTCGLVLTYEDKVFQSYFHSTCGGNTTRASKFFREPSLPPLSGASCRFCQRSDAYLWHAEFREETVRKALAGHDAVQRELAQARLELGRIAAIEPVLDPGDIYPEYIRIVHANGSFEIHGPILRSILNAIPPERSLLSVAIEPCKVRGDVLHFTGHGWGHGVGMCQFGAQGQAAEGRDFLAILMHYYPGAAIMRAWPKDLAAKALAAVEPGEA